jgi:hypothetical protein
MRSLHPDTGNGDLRALAETRRAYRALADADAGAGAQAQPPPRPRLDVYA